jgi:hypothetical protein
LTRLGARASAITPTGRFDEEDGPPAPAPAEDVRVDEHAAEQRAGDPGEAGHGAERAEDGGTLLFGERDVHDGEYLREHRRGCQTLDHTEQDEQARAGRQPAQQRGDHEGEDPRDEHALTPEDVAEAAAGDHPGCEGELVSREGPLDLRVGRVDISLDRGNGDADDTDVQEFHEGGENDDDQADPCLRVHGTGTTDGLRRVRAQRRFAGCHSRSPIQQSAMMKLLSKLTSCLWTVKPCRRPASGRAEQAGS